MSEEKAETGVNEAEPVAQAPEAEATATPPTGEQPGAEDSAEQPEKAVPYPRFKEVINQKNEKDKVIEDLRKRLEAVEKGKPEAQVPVESRAEKYAKKLVAKGLDAEAAKLLAGSIEEMAAEIAEERVMPLTQAAIQKETDNWVADFAAKNADYSELDPEMTKIFNAMPEPLKREMVKSPAGIEFIYAKAKLAKLGSVVAQAKEDGKSEAYASKSVKKSLTSGGGGSATPPQKPITRKDILNLSNEEYQARKAEIMELARKGELK